MIETPSLLTKLQRWIHRKLRCYRIKQLGRAIRLYWKLKKLGIPARDLGRLVTSSRGPGGCPEAQKSTEVSARASTRR